MSQNQEGIKIAAISQEDLENINKIQSKIKTIDKKDVILIAYEK